MPAAAEALGCPHPNPDPPALAALLLSVALATAATLSVVVRSPCYFLPLVLRPTVRGRLRSTSRALANFSRSSRRLVALIFTLPIARAAFLNTPAALILLPWWRKLIAELMAFAVFIG